MPLTPPSSPRSSIKRRSKRNRLQADADNDDQPVTPPAQTQRRTRSQATAGLPTPEDSIATAEASRGTQCTLFSSALQGVIQSEKRVIKPKFPVHDLAPDIRAMIESTTMRPGLVDDRLPVVDKSLLGRVSLQHSSKRYTGEVSMFQTKSIKSTTEEDVSNAKESAVRDKVDEEEAQENSKGSKKRRLLLPDFGTPGLR